MNLPLVNTAKHTVKLPGCGLDVEYRPFFVKEQKILLQATESEDPAQIASATNDMVKACTFEKLNLEDITSTDIEYLLLKIRAKSVGETAKINLKCSHCEHPNEYELNDMLQLYPALKIAHAKFLEVYNLVKDDYNNQQEANNVF